MAPKTLVAGQTFTKLLRNTRSLHSISAFAATAHQGKNALITGGASGLGRDLALGLHAQHTNVLIADKNEAMGSRLIQELNDKRPGSASFRRVDVTDWEDQVALFKFATNKLGRIDYVFPNAGIIESTYLAHTPAETIPYVKPDLSTIDINLKGVLYTSQLAVQVFRTQPIVDGFRGQIVATASLASFSAIPYMPLYSASKFAVLGFVRAFGGQLAHEHITVNAVCPNITRTNLTTTEAFNEFEKNGLLTSNAKVTEAFMSFLGDSKTTGEAAEVSLDQIYRRPPTEPVDGTVVHVIAGLSGGFKAAYAPASPTP